MVSGKHGPYQSTGDQIMAAISGEAVALPAGQFAEGEQARIPGDVLLGNRPNTRVPNVDHVRCIYPLQGLANKSLKKYTFMVNRCGFLLH